MAAADTNTHLSVALADELSDIREQANYVNSITTLIWENQEFHKLPSHHQCAVQALHLFTSKLCLSVEEFANQLNKP